MTATCLYLTVQCGQCGTVWPLPPMRDMAHAQCPGCRYEFTLTQTAKAPGTGERVYAPSRRVRVGR